MYNLYRVFFFLRHWAQTSVVKKMYVGYVTESHVVLSFHGFRESSLSDLLSWSHQSPPAR